MESRFLEQLAKDYPYLIPAVICLLLILDLRRRQAALLKEGITVGGLEGLLLDAVIGLPERSRWVEDGTSFFVKVVHLCERRQTVDVLFAYGCKDKILDRADTLCGKVITVGLFGIATLLSLLMYWLGLDQHLALIISAVVAFGVVGFWLVITQWELDLVSTVRVLKDAQKSSNGTVSIAAGPTTAIDPAPVATKVAKTGGAHRLHSRGAGSSS